MDKRSKINLGCGRTHNPKEYIGIDIVDFGQDYVVDISKEKLPFNDSSIDEIYCSHVLEHLWDAQYILNECWRVLKPDRIMIAKTPFGLWAGAHNPVHKQVITECWFDFLGRDKTKIYGYKQWSIKILRRQNNNSEVYCEMSPKKS